MTGAAGADKETMLDLDRPVEPERLRFVRHHAVARLGLLYDATLVRRIATCIVGQVRAGAVGEGITHAALVAGSAVPSWVAHRGMLNHLLTLVAVRSYEQDRVFLTALVRAHRDEPPPAPGFCAFLEDVGVVSSRTAREACLEAWDHHWKLTVSRYDG